MIKDTRRGGPPESMTSPESFDTFYRRKLDMFAAQLRDVVFDSVFVVDKECACYSCGCRVFCRGQEGLLHGCIKCLSHRVRSRSDFDCRAILSRYPQMEECEKEWEASGHKNPAQHPPRLPQIKQGDEELGKQIKQARLKMGMTTHELAAKIKKVKGGHLSERAVRGYEGGNSRPSKNVMEQLKNILGLEV